MKRLLPTIFICCTISTFAQESKSYLEEIDSLKNVADAQFFSQTDSAYYNLDRIYRIATANEDLVPAMDALISASDLAGYHHELSKIRINLSRLDSILSKTKESKEDVPDTLYYECSLLFGQGMYAFMLNNFRASRMHFREMVERIEVLSPEAQTTELMDLMLSGNSYLGKMYNDEAKYDMARQFYANNIHHIETRSPDDLGLRYGNYALIAQVLRRQGEHEASNTYLAQALDYYEQNSKNPSRIISTSQVMAYNHIALEQYTAAAEKLRLMQRTLPEGHGLWYRYHKTKAELAKITKDYDTALFHLKENLSAMERKWEGIAHQDVSLAHNEIGLLLWEMGEQKQALERYDTALKLFDPKHGDQKTLLEILRNKAVLLSGNSDASSLETALSTVNLGISVLDSLKPSFQSDLDKLELMEDAFPLLEAGLEAIFKSESRDINLRDLDSDSPAKAFRLMEKSKSILIMEAVLTSKAMEFKDIPSDLLNREQSLKSEITYLEKQIAKSKSDTKALENPLFRLKRDYRNLVDSIETLYPTYYDLKYKTEVVSLERVQETLARGEKLVSYFYGDKAIYALAASPSDSRMERISISADFQDDIRKAREGLTNPKSDIVNLSRITYGLYSKLLEPLVDSESAERLILIPDGPLHYLPFAALNTEPDVTRYLMEQNAVSYANSSTLLLELQERKQDKLQVLAFAPSFDGSQEVATERSKLLPLPHNKKEVEMVTAAINGRAFVDSDATLQNFRSQLSQFGILHLATHAVFDDALPEYSYLAFSQTHSEDEEDVLFTADLYNMKTDAALVTLSACETGLGELRRGEGFLSLARGFFYSGAASLASTLWKVNDASSSRLMGDFYANLAKGQRKDVSLQQAQIAFLDANRENALAHPYYWSGFVISGNTAALTSPSFNIWMLIGICLGVLVLFLLIYRKMGIR